MADRRKLQGEIERCLKKVDEGVEIFEDIWKKVLSATNSNQKEKFETDLKKEIKKLQRLRDQIKSWIANSDIKDKSSLLEHRRLIEMQMERFKVVERETKTKAYSKDGLGAAAKLDPQTKEKADATQWISNIIDSLQLQLDQFESELELRAGANKKKGKDSKCEALKEQQERHKFHIETLEKIMRHIDNDKLPVDKMRDLRDDIEYYVESNQDPSFQENTYLYDGLDLEEICTDPPLLASSPVDGEEFLMDRIMSIPSPTNSSSPSPCPNVNANHSNEKNEEIDRKLQKSNSEEKKSISPASLSISRPQSSLHSQNSSSTYSSDSNSINGNHHLSTTPSPLTVFAANEDGQQRISLDSSKPYVNSVDHAATGGLLSNGNLSATTNINSVILASSGNPSVATAPSPQIVTGTVTPPGTSTLSSSALSSINNSSQVHNGLPEVLPVLNGPLSASATIPQKVRSDELSLRTMAQLVIANAELEKTMPLSAPVDSSNVVYSNSSEVLSQSTSSSSLEQCSISLQEQQLSSQLPQQLLQAPQTNTIHLNPLIGMVPLGPMLLAKEQLYQSAMVDACFQHLPHPSDSERLRQFLPRNPCPTPTYYPSASFPHVDNVEIYQRIGTETLFFIFYYMEGTKAQYLAAKALKKQSWRFHTKYMMWFQRFEEPKQITEEFEQGTYIYFDYEKWSRKKKEGFTFEYRYLEDRDLN